MDRCELEEANLALRYAMKDLTQLQRISIHAFYDRTVPEVADELGVPPNYVYATCNRAFARMRKNLAKLGIVKVSDILSDDKDG